MPFRILFSTLALLLGCQQPMHAQWFLTPPTDTLPVIVAGASAEVLAQPTRAIVYAALAGRDTAQEVATTRAASARERATAALRQLGISADAVTLWGVGMGADMPMAAMRGAAPEGARQELATRFGLRVVVDPISQLDQVLTALSRAGIESIPMVRFEVSNDSEARRTATEQAVMQAREQAITMARAAGARLGDLRSLTTMSGLEEVASDTRFFYSGFSDRGAALAPSDVRVRVMVQGAWRLRP